MLGREGKEEEAPVRKGKLVPSRSEQHRANTRDAAKVNRRQISCCGGEPPPEAVAVEEEDVVVLREAIPSRAVRIGVPCKQPCRATAWPSVSSICTSQGEVPGSPTDLPTEQMKQ